MITVHVDGGAFVEPPKYKFHDAYFSVLSDENKLIHFEKNIGDYWNGIAEYRAIEWAVRNIKERPLVITNDCMVAIWWARKGKRPTPRIDMILLPLIKKGGDVIIEYKHNNYADVWNAENHSPKIINGKRTKLKPKNMKEFWMF